MTITDYGLTEITAPTVEPFLKAEAKKQLEIATAETAHDTHVERLIKAARAHVEIATNRQIITATYDLRLDRFPAASDPILIPKAPLQSVASVKYVDAAGDTQTWASSKYDVATWREPGQITRLSTVSWPVTKVTPGAVTVRFDAGYGLASSVPELLKEAMELMIAHWFANREAVMVRWTAADLPLGVEPILNGYRYGDEFTAYAR